MTFLQLLLQLALFWLLIVNLIYYFLFIFSRVCIPDMSYLDFGPEFFKKISVALLQAAFKKLIFIKLFAIIVKSVF